MGQNRGIGSDRDLCRHRFNIRGHRVADHDHHPPSPHPARSLSVFWSTLSPRASGIRFFRKHLRNQPNRERVNAAGAYSDSDFEIRIRTFRIPQHKMTQSKVFQFLLYDDDGEHSCTLSIGMRRRRHTGQPLGRWANVCGHDGIAPNCKRFFFT